MVNMKTKTITGTAKRPSAPRAAILYVNVECPYCKKTVAISLTPGPSSNTVIERVEVMQSDGKETSKKECKKPLSTLEIELESR